MRILRGRSVAAGMAVTAMMVFGLSGSSWAKSARTRIHTGHRAGMMAAMMGTGESVVPGIMPDEVSDGSERSEGVATGGLRQYWLRMSNLHTGESLNLMYRVGNVYVPEALEKLNYFLRDHNTQDVATYDPKEFDVLHALMARVGRLNGVIDVVCGYRTPATNAALRQNSPRTGVAEHSQHMEGHAIDIRVPGVSTVALRNAALSLHAGGVGYYPVSQFVHVDVGPVREWAFGASSHKAGRRSRGSSASAGI